MDRISPSHDQNYNALATSTIALGEVTALDHELLDDAMKGGTLVGRRAFAIDARGGQGVKVFRGFRQRLAVETHHNFAQVLTLVLDLEKDL